MANNTASAIIERQDWVEPVATGLQKAVSSAYESAGSVGRPVKNFLHGVWLGHPLHPVFTDVPIGAWTATLVLDVMDAAGHQRCAPAAEVALQVGLAGAAGSAITGLTDWQATDGRARRKGIIHGLLNLTATTLYTASLIQRKQKHRSSGRTLAFCGFAISAAAAWIGGDLVYNERIGVDHSQQPPQDMTWAPVAQLAELREGEPQRVEVSGVRVLLVRQGDKVYAIGEVCSHLGGPLAEGKVEAGTVRCPWHGSSFCLRDGSVVDGPATTPEPAYETRLIAGTIEVRPIRA
jgi:nitrite reductase/ring-hydroxylating ferredoxin subunit/uncharacterized membrane protein